MTTVHTATESPRKGGGKPGVTKPFRVIGIKPDGTEVKLAAEGAYANATAKADHTARHPRAWGLWAKVIVRNVETGQVVFDATPTDPDDLDTEGR